MQVGDDGQMGKRSGSQNRNMDFSLGEGRGEDSGVESNR